MTLEEIFRFIEAKEAGKRSITRLLDTQAASAIRSTYNKNRKEALVENSTKATNQRYVRIVVRKVTVRNPTQEFVSLAALPMDINAVIVVAYITLITSAEMVNQATRKLNTTTK